MGLDLWFQQDVARILASTQAAMAAAMRASVGVTAPLDPSMESIALAESYRQGFSDALRAVAVAFGVAPPGDSRPVLPAGAALLVDAEAWYRERDENGRPCRIGGGAL